MHHPGFRQDTTGTLLILQQGPRKGDFLILKSASGGVPAVALDSPATDLGQSFVLMLFLWAGRRGREVGERQHPPVRGGQKPEVRGLAFGIVGFLPVRYLSVGPQSMCSSVFIPVYLFDLRWAQVSVSPMIPRGMPPTRMMWLEIYSGKRPWLSLSLSQTEHFSLSTGKFFQ